MKNITEQDVVARLLNESEEIKNTVSQTAARREICNQCDKKEHVLGVEYCGSCKCILMFKTAFRYARCPENKWDVEIPSWAKGNP